MFKTVSAVLFAALLAGGSAKADQILANPGFETGSLLPWFNNQNFQGTTPWFVTSTGCLSGSFCAQDDGNIELKQTFNPVATAIISDVNFWALHPDPAAVAVAYDFFYQSGAQDEFVVSTNGTNWTQFDATSHLRANDQLVGFSVFGNSAGITRLDDLSITTQTSAVPEPYLPGFITVASLMIFGRARRRSLN